MYRTHLNTLARVLFQLIQHVPGVFQSCSRSLERCFPFRINDLAALVPIFPFLDLNTKLWTKKCGQASLLANVLYMKNKSDLIQTSNFFPWNIGNIGTFKYIYIYIYSIIIIELFFSSIKSSTYKILRKPTYADRVPERPKIQNFPRNIGTLLYPYLKKSPKVLGLSTISCIMGTVDRANHQDR